MTKKQEILNVLKQLGKLETIQVIDCKCFLNCAYYVYIEHDAGLVILGWGNAKYTLQELKDLLRDLNKLSTTPYVA